MSKAVYCDRCGKLFQEGVIKQVKIQFLGYASEEEMLLDLCEKCHDKLEDFIR